MMNDIKQMTYGEQMRISAAEAQGWSGPWRFGNTHLHGTSPDGSLDKHVPDKVDNIIKLLFRKTDVLIEGIESVRGLIDDSTGVVGLHQNGDVALWNSSTIDEWLYSFNDAEHIIQELRQ